MGSAHDPEMGAPIFAQGHAREKRLMSPRILIVEDDEPLTTLLRYNLEAEGYEVESAARGD